MDQPLNRWINLLPRMYPKQSVVTTNKLLSSCVTLDITVLYWNSKYCMTIPIMIPNISCYCTCYLECYYTPASTKLKGGILVSHCPSVRPSVCPSLDRIVSALYLQQYLSDPFHICTYYQATLEVVSRVNFVAKLKHIGKFFKFFWLCLLMTWDPIWLNSMGNHGAAGVSSERRRSSCSSLFRKII